MSLYGITADFRVIQVRLASWNMMNCLEVAQAEKEAIARRDELKALHDAKQEQHP